MYKIHSVRSHYLKNLIVIVCETLFKNFIFVRCLDPDEEIDLINVAFEQRSSQDSGAEIKLPLLNSIEFLLIHDGSHLSISDCAVLMSLTGYRPWRT